MNYMVLYYICEGAGLLMVVGGIWLIYKEKIFLDSQTNVCFRQPCVVESLPCEQSDHAGNWSGGSGQ